MSEACHTTSDVSWTPVITNGVAFPKGTKEHPPAFGKGSLDELAKEFGVDAHIVQALAQRLSCLH